MTYTEEQLQQIDQFASIYLRPTDIAVILGVRIEEFKQDIQDESNPAFTKQDIQDESNPAFTAYRHGKALSKVQLHQQEMTLAKVGSPLALQTARENLLDMEDDE